VVGLLWWQFEPRDRKNIVPLKNRMEPVSPSY
jgi:hypothetical protein